MSITPQAVQKFLDEVEKSKASRKRAWDNLQEIRWALNDTAGIELPAPARKTIDLPTRLSAQIDVKISFKHFARGQSG